MKLQIVHTNDLHNHFPYKTLKKIVNEGCLLLDSGDAIAGSNTVFRFHEPILDQMRDMGYDAMGMGNREFHYLRKIFSGRQTNAGFPILAANLVDMKGKVRIPDQLVLMRNGAKIGLFGLTNPQYPVGSLWESITGWRFPDPLETAEKIVKSLQASGAHVIACLSHLGFKTDQVLAEKIKGIHVLLGGHSHTILKKVYRKNDTIILQTGSHGQFVGNWELTLSLEKDQVQSWNLEGELIPANE